MFLKKTGINFVSNAKISWKLTFLYAFLFSVALLVMNISIMMGVKYFLVNQAKQHVEQDSMTIVGTVEEWRDVLEGDLADKVNLEKNSYIRIYDETGKIYYASHDFNFQLVEDKPPVSSIKQIGAGENHLLYKVIKMKIGGSTAYLQIVKDMKEEYGLLDKFYLFMAVLSVICIAISIVSGFLLSRRVLKPISDITTIAQKISFSDLNRRIEVEGPDDELSKLARTFNEMIGRLQGSFEKQTQFVSDSSHELRTPITIIQGYIDIIGNRERYDEAVFLESVDAIKGEIVNMSQLLEKLLFIAKCDSNVLKLDKDEFLLNELVDEVVRDCRILAPNHNITCEINDTSLVYADRRMIKQALRAVIDNSIKFTPEKGKIIINSINQNNKMKILITDTGTGIPEGETGNIFNRFYRVDKARSRKTGGSGLGLHIVKMIIEAHGGTVTAHSVYGEGTTMNILLPLEQDKSSLML